ncbi:MAG: lyase family protein, partial [Oscillospiraceae bacterium]|nr:lyase family protein [Oscillospiraceae bacterium]
MKLWAGRFSGEISGEIDDFNSSIAIDCRMVREDIAGSLAHAGMLAKQGIISREDGETIRRGLREIAAEIEDGSLVIDPAAEDIHTFIETELTARIGDAGKRLHTGRSRNDQVALDLRLYLKKRCEEIKKQLRGLIAVLCDRAEREAGTVMSGYTHLQRAQPVTFGYHLMAYAEMFLRDIGRIEDAGKRMDLSPLGSGALAGTTYPLDREA